MCNYVLTCDNDEEATDEKNRETSLRCVKITKIGLRGREDYFVPRPKPAQNMTGISIFFSHVANDYWELGTKSCNLARSCGPVV